MKNKSYYYDIENDITYILECNNDFIVWCFIIVGGRNTGKTYSVLKSCYLNKRKFVFVKRTNEDVKLLCAGSGKIGSKMNEYGVDLSPFKSINRDLNSNVKAFSIGEGLGGFWECDSEGSANGQPIGYLISLNAISKFKGFDLSDCEWLIFDEFIPQPWEKVNRKEGEQLLDLYKTISRDREHRGKESLKLICLANAVSISNPVSNILEITDKIADMEITGTESYINDRGIFIHIIKDNEDFLKKEMESPIYKAMGSTSWGAMAFHNKFGYNDLTVVGKVQLKGYKPHSAFLYKNSKYYVYMRDGKYYITHSAHQGELYNLNRENEQKKYYYDYVIDLQSECIDGNVKFESYSMYDLLMNYKKIFKI